VADWQIFKDDNDQLGVFVTSDPLRVRSGSDALQMGTANTPIGPTTWGGTAKQLLDGLVPGVEHALQGYYASFEWSSALLFDGGWIDIFIDNTKLARLGIDPRLTNPEGTIGVDVPNWTLFGPWKFLPTSQYATLRLTTFSPQSPSSGRRFLFDDLQGLIYEDATEDSEFVKETQPTADKFTKETTPSSGWTQVAGRTDESTKVVKPTDKWSKPSGPADKWTKQ
jgi:hypothetical protein